MSTEKRNPAETQLKEQTVSSTPDHGISHDKTVSQIGRGEPTASSDSNWDYEDGDIEPELHARTYLALAAMFLLNLVQLIALQGPPTVLTYIGRDLHNPERQAWVPTSLSLVQAVIGPVISFASDTFQARKPILVWTSAISFVGCAIAPGSNTIYRLIGAQTLIGFGFASVPLAYCVPSEILPRRWRPMAQSAMNVAASLGACAGPLAIGALTKRNGETGWRMFYWFQMAIWGLTAVGIQFGYQPPKRHTHLDQLSFWQKLGRLDLAGTALFTTGLTLFLVGLNLGGELFPWTSAPPLATLITGIAVLTAFALYEWKGNSTGILHHDLFGRGRERGQTFAICVGLIFIEAVVLFSYILFYPVMTTMLFETDPVLMVVRFLPFWIASAISTLTFGFASMRMRTIRSPLFVGWLLWTAGTIGFATVQPDHSTRAVIFATLSGFGFGAPLILIVAGVQLSTPHHLIATATAVTTSARAVGATVFTSIYAAAVARRLGSYIPEYVAKATTQAGLPSTSVGAFIEALGGGAPAKLQAVRGITPAIISAGSLAYKQAYADGLRVVYIIAAPFGVLACVVCFFLGDMRKTMNYHVDAPVEKLVARARAGKEAEHA
ncbi:hypothetical protein JDV02_002474 [Purpureocillium takamizusanense]|uniref:Major facilitator superfamily (MFS) profile domain-containing protein n=1 Tax=Purpureocillium takamizusanense TaxID=2060973 RepID=A0A9Q8V8L5_9HYPO|nr:uncharacterized protein JDV02_002474 [Purpureocillium takamizusanense]UNI15994.1 hypothetical protein JDV02_002474 [Purpureocillium takamizusanense]